MFDLDQIPVPDLTDPNFAPFWQGTSEHKLKIQQCSDCGTHRWPPRVTCRSCRSTAVDWVEVAPRGTLFTYTTVGRATAKGFSKVPYTVGFVALEAPAGIRVIGNVIDVEPSDLVIGMALKGRFTKAGANGEMTLIHWAPPSAGA
jgi:uncharacterized OB-fold protein